MKCKNRYRILLDETKEFDKNHRFNPLEQGNLFTILDMENKEVSAHSAFLYFVFKPFQTSDDSYDYGNLKELLKILLKLKGVEKTVDEYKCIDICREVVTEFGRLDFLITADEDIFVIELKT